MSGCRVLTFCIARFRRASSSLSTLGACAGRVRSCSRVAPCCKSWGPYLGHESLNERAPSGAVSFRVRLFELLLRSGGCLSRISHRVAGVARRCVCDIGPRMQRVASSSTEAGHRV
ncbi:unnamed protein product [Amoebophrya sp. A25]|nr:unnamed protein product [Amoebophrya sp. A25]|eukprot:GSA25T00021297001.1